MRAASLRRLFGLVIVTLALTVEHAPAHAQECGSSCSVGRGVCAMQARTARTACLQGCAAGDLHCHAGCMTAMRTARGTCKTTRTDCMTACPGIPAGTAAPCVAGCSATAKTCFVDAFRAGTACVQGCKAAGGTALMSCLVQCAATIDSSRAACVAAFRGCLSGCPVPTPLAQCSRVPCGGRCVIGPTCPPGGPCPEYPSRLGECLADSTGACGCVPVSPPPTRTPQPTPTPQCTGAVCGGACTIDIPFPCPAGEVCDGPDIPALQGQCASTATGTCDCIPVEPTPPTPRATRTPQCGGRVCGGPCVFSPTCPPGQPCSEAEFVIRPGECTADPTGACQCVPVSPPPTPTPQCGDAAACGGACTIGIPFPCPVGATCNGPAIPVLQGQCTITTTGGCDCVPITPTPAPTPTPQCGGPMCGGPCLIFPTCPPGALCPQRAFVVRQGECTAGAAGSCQCVAVEPTPGCATDADCDDGNPCTADRCVNGICEHGCVCLTSTGAPGCCGGPSELCVAPCGSDATGTCGGSCPLGAACESMPSAAAACGCVSGPGGPCGGNIFAPPPVCAPGLICHQALPDITGYCEKPDCVPLFTAGCAQTADCCEPCGNGTHAPCGVCLNGTCEGAP